MIIVLSCLDHLTHLLPPSLPLSIITLTTKIAAVCVYSLCLFLIICVIVVQAFIHNHHSFIHSNCFFQLIIQTTGFGWWSITRKGLAHRSFQEYIIHRQDWGGIHHIVYHICASTALLPPPNEYLCQFVLI